ncbi:glycoside hydrolase superfamily [Zychaea mexicana]|uniref:glycoside hydrolase superfamily n=1 Tax=Zychaea mexicana TaxID=64656 RepID=UPI0022FECB30|nr:glycoside hydrolase superfamily [Zychaea mexicana]KAI9480242.1 glycoside hydrolase superfamily [Zychaea mexicana]
MFGRTQLTRIATATSVLLLSLIGTTTQPVSAAGFPDGYNVITYWGQNSAGTGSSQKDLATYCDDTSDVLVIGFITNFNVGGLPTLNVANACEGSVFEGTSLLQCDHIGKDIKTCQKKGKKVLLSLGGASGAYGFTSDKEGTTFAKTMWDLFGGGESDTRPFGEAVIDGFDLDIEGGGPTGYAAFVKELRNLFEEDSSKDYYVTAAPQCPFPDAMLGEVIDDVGIDAVNVQFYNNYCSTGGSNFNFETWDDWAKNKSPNKDVKIYLGIPGSTSAAGTGYITYEDLEPVFDKVTSFESFGGITIWDASQSHGNKDTEPNFATAISKLVRTGESNSNTTSITATATTTTTAKETSTATSTKSDHSATATPSDTSCIQDGDSCSEHGKQVCASNGFAVCNHDKWVVTQCAVGLTCMSTTEGSSIYCAQTQDGDLTSSSSSSSSADTCDKKKRSVLHTKSAPRPYKSTRVTSQLTVVKVADKRYEAVVNARRLDTKAFGNTVVVEMKMPAGITVDSVTTGKVKQDGQTAKLQVKNPNKKSMGLVFSIAGSIDEKSDVFVAPDVNNMKFMT